MGLGPFFTLPFDRIFIIPGVVTPLVMRPTRKGRYRFIGQCYVHGLGDVLESLSKLPEAEYITIE